MPGACGSSACRRQLGDQVFIKTGCVQNSRLWLWQIALTQPKFALLNLLAIVALFLLCAALGLSLSIRRSAWRDAHVGWPYYARKPIASPHQVLYQRLVVALPGHIVMSHVPVGGVIGVRRGIDFELWDKRIRHLYYDFVVCTQDATVLTAIELDDKPESEKLRANSDWIKARASAAASVQLIRWRAKALPDQAAIQQAVGELEMHYAGGISANPCWWPPMASTSANPPLP